MILSTPLPYSTTDDTSNYGDDYVGSPGATCGSTSGYLGGDDVVYAYTPTADTSIDISLTGIGTYTGIFVYTDCGNIGVNCETGAVNGFQGRRYADRQLFSNSRYNILHSNIDMAITTKHSLYINHYREHMYRPSSELCRC
ncbi:MAG: hypothetical protein R2812_03035 [Gelidibacter sp.]